MDGPTAFELLERTWDVVSLLVVAIAGVLREWWLPGRTHRRIVKGLEAERDGYKMERDEWKNLALRRGSLTERALVVGNDAIALAQEEELDHS